MSEGSAIRCEGIGKCFLQSAEPYQSLRARLGGMRLSRSGRSPAGGSLLWALRDVSFEVPAGSIFGVVGENGSGKSVLLQILARVTKPTTGRAEVYGAMGSILRLGAMLVPELTGRENIYQVGTLLRLGRTAVDRHFEEIVEFSGAGAQIDSLVRGYSAGTQVRLAFAVLVFLESRVLLIDEALSLADEEFRRRCIDRIRRMSAQGQTVVLVSHEMNMMTELCDRALLLERGRVRCIGQARKVIATYCQEQTNLATARK